MPPMSPRDRQRTDTLTRQNPALERVPYDDRLRIVRAAWRHPSVWATGLGLFAAWVALAGGTFGTPIRTYEAAPDGRLDLIAEVFLPAILPWVLIVSVIVLVHHRHVRRTVGRDYPG